MEEQYQAPNYTVRDAMVLCGLNNEVQFQGLTPAERFATDIFSNFFISA